MTEPRRRMNELHYIIFEKEGTWIAMCLEHYIGSQGCTREEAMAGLKCAYTAERDYTMRNKGGPFYGIMGAPEEYHKMWWSDRTDVERGMIYEEEKNTLTNITSMMKYPLSDNNEGKTA